MKKKDPKLVALKKRIDKLSSGIRFPLTKNVDAVVDTDQDITVDFVVGEVNFYRRKGIKLSDCDLSEMMLLQMGPYDFYGTKENNSLMRVLKRIPLMATAIEEFNAVHKVVKSLSPDELNELMR